MPARDRSGSLCIFFASYDTHSAVCHYRMKLPAQALNDAGHTCSVGSAVVSRGDEGVDGLLPDLSIVRRPDVVVLQPGHGADWTGVVEVARDAGQVVVVDIDDWWWDLAPGIPAVTREDIRPWLPVLERMVRTCHLVTTSTQFIRDRIAAWADPPPVRVLRNAMDLGRWGSPEVVDDGPVLGYAGALFGHVEDVRLMRDWLGAFLDRHDLRIIHVGDHPDLPAFAEVAAVNPRRVVLRPGIAWEEYAASGPMRGMDIGLVPLLDNPFNQAKSALKGLEYAACGVPFAASASAEYVALGSGTLIGESLSDQTPQAWIAALERLLDPAIRRQQAAAQARRVAAEDISWRWQEWEDLYLELVAAARAAS
jgi:glycosyltransferase involved in cell wall biosynthesis